MRMCKVMSNDLTVVDNNSLSPEYDMHKLYSEMRMVMGNGVVDEALFSKVILSGSENQFTLLTMGWGFKYSKRTIQRLLAAARYADLCGLTIPKEILYNHSLDKPIFTPARLESYFKDRYLAIESILIGEYFEYEGNGLNSLGMTFKHYWEIIDKYGTLKRINNLKAKIKSLQVTRREMSTYGVDYDEEAFKEMLDDDIADLEVTEDMAEQKAHYIRRFRKAHYISLKYETPGLR